MRALGVERLDIVPLHDVRRPSPLVARAEVFAELLKRRDEGKIAYVGLSSCYIGAMRQVLTQPEVAVVHPLLDRSGMGILDGGAVERSILCGYCAAACPEFIIRVI